MFYFPTWTNLPFIMTWTCRLESELPGPSQALRWSDGRGRGLPRVPWPVSPQPQLGLSLPAASLARCVHVSPEAFLSVIHTFCIQQTDATRSSTGSRSGGINGPLTLVGLGPLARRLELVCPKPCPAELMGLSQRRR